jgi:hypothetical protein
MQNRYRHLRGAEVRFANWDLTTVHLVDSHTGTVLCRLYPQDKTKNASGLRRPLDKLTADTATRQSEPAKPAGAIAPLLARLIDQQAAAGLPPPYLPKDEGDDT